MDDSPRLQVANDIAMLQAAEPSLWKMRLISASQMADFSLKSWITLAALLVPLLLFYALKAYRTMQYHQRKPFPFLSLPRELRDMVYENLLQDPIYPAPTPSPPSPSTPLSRLLPFTRTSSPKNPSTLIFLASKQLHTEYLSLLCKRSTFHLSITPETALKQSPIWPIPPSTLSKITHCTLSLTTSSAMLGVPDPRAMTPSSWPLTQKIRTQLLPMRRLKSFSLDAKALGDPLWNPLWIWYHASQSFKNMGCGEEGPRLGKITFSLDTWSPGENYLERDEEGRWRWCCMKGHAVGLDGGSEVTVREFCGFLYKECGVCKPVEEEAE